MNEELQNIKPILGCRKVAFANEKQALYYIDKLKATSTRSKVPQSAYLCPKCSLWHLTSQPYRDETKIKAYDNIIKKYEAIIKKQLDKIKKLELVLTNKNNEIANKKAEIERWQVKYFNLTKFKGVK